MLNPMRVIKPSGETDHAPAGVGARGCRGGGWGGVHEDVNYDGPSRSDDGGAVAGVVIMVGTSTAVKAQRRPKLSRADGQKTWNGG